MNCEKNIVNFLKCWDFFARKFKSLIQEKKHITVIRIDIMK